MTPQALPLGPVPPPRPAGEGYPVHRGCGGALLLREATRAVGDEDLLCAKCHARLSAPDDVPLALVLRARDAALVERGVGAWPRCSCCGDFSRAPAPPLGPPRVSVTFDVATTSEANSREHFRVKGDRVQAQRAATQTALTLPRGCIPYLGPFLVRLTRRSTGALDADAVPRSLKAIQDAVAAALHTDDGSVLVAWVWRQEKHSPLVPQGVRVEIWGPGAMP